MNIIYFANGVVGLEVLQWLREQDDPVAALVVHPTARGACRQDIVDASRLPPELVFQGDRLDDPATVEAIDHLKPDIGLSVFFGYILQPELLSLFPKGCLNLHPAYLPYNRGTYPNVWSIVDGTPAGVTLHYMDAGVDTGDIVSQREMRLSATDTGQTLYRRLERECVRLLRESWPAITDESAPRLSQPRNAGTSHKLSDVRKIDCIDLDQTYRARDLIDVMRARTFPPHRGAYFEAEGKRIYIRVQLVTEDEINPAGEAPEG